MAYISGYDDAHDNSVWVVQRSDGSYEGRKEFYSHEEAEVYKNYLQSIEDRERSLELQQQIINNQQKLISSQEQRLGRPRVTRQVLDPQYEEWLRYKKATDPGFLAWKAEEEKKAKIREAEARKKAIQRQAEEDKAYVESNLKSLSYLEGKISKELNIFGQISALYNSARKVSTIGSKVISFYSDNGYSDEFKISGMVLIDGYDSENHIHNKYELVSKLMKEIPDVPNYISELRRLLQQGSRYSFDSKIKSLSALENALYCFYMYFGKGLSKIESSFDGLSSPYHMDGYFSTWKPNGIFTRMKIRSAFNEYMSCNKDKYKVLIEINRKFKGIIKDSGLSIIF